MSTIPVNAPVAVNARAQRVEQVRAWMSPLNVHIAAAALLLLASLWFIVQLVLAFSTSGTRGDEAISSARAQRNRISMHYGIGGYEKADSSTRLLAAMNESAPQG